MTRLTAMKQHKGSFFSPAELDEVQIIPAQHGHHRDHHSSPSFHPIDISRAGYIFSTLNHSEKDEEKNNEMSNHGISRTEFWIGAIGIIFTCLASAVVATWTISNNINDKTNDSRKELAGNIQSNKTEISLRLDRLEDKFDSSSKDTADKLMRIEMLLQAKGEKN